METQGKRMNTTGIKAILWKEWRENIKWAVFALIGFSIAILHLLYDKLQPDSTVGDAFGAISPVTLLMPPFFAAILGVLQVGGELRRDQWAFLIHRPLSRSAIFGGKALAGLVLYLGVTLLPIMVLALWAQIPGNMASPFTWRLLLPLLADILMGVPFYFAGMLAAIRPAYIYGSRVLGFAPAIICTLAGRGTFQEFWQALAAITFVTAMLGLAAWGSFLTTGTYERQPRPAKIALGSTMFFSSIVILAILIFVFTSTANSIWPEYSKRREALQRTAFARYISHEYALDGTGQIVRLTRRGRKQTVTNLQGKPVKAISPIQDEFQNFEEVIYFPPYHRTRQLSYRSYQRYFSVVFPNKERGVVWYYDRTKNRVVGYSLKTRRVIGYMGPGGFSDSDANGASRFTEPLVSLTNKSGHSILRFPQVVYLVRVKTGTRQIVPLSLFQPPANEDILHVAHLDNGQIAVASSKTIHFFTSTGRLLFRTPLENQGHESGSVKIFTIPKSSRYFLLYTLNSKDGDVNRQFLTTLSPQGVIQRQQALPRLPSAPWNPPMHVDEVTAGMPPILMAAQFVGSYFGPQRTGNPEHLKTNRVEWLIEFALSFGTSLLCALLVIPVARRCAMSKSETRKWVLGIFALGPFVLPTMLALREWPTRIACPSCAKKRVITREHCERCDSVFPVTPLDGTEIFSDTFPEEEPLSQLRLAS
jgi:hypothetical protein